MSVIDMHMERERERERDRDVKTGRYQTHLKNAPENSQSLDTKASTPKECLKPLQNIHLTPDEGTEEQKSI